jgi:hypothetical protein
MPREFAVTSQIPPSAALLHALGGIAPQKPAAMPGASAKPQALRQAPPAAPLPKVAVPEQPPTTPLPRGSLVNIRV